MEADEMEKVINRIVNNYWEDKCTTRNDMRAAVCEAFKAGMEAAAAIYKAD